MRQSLKSNLLGKQAGAAPGPADRDARVGPIDSCLAKTAINGWVRLLLAISVGLLFPMAQASGRAPTPTLPGADTITFSQGSNEADTLTPRAADSGWREAARDKLATGDYRASQTPHGLQAPNRAHRLLAYFGPKGIRLHDRAATGGPELASLSLVAAGRGAALEPVEAGTMAQAGQRVEIRRPGIVEWYENTPKGLEQGFTVAARTQGEGSLVLELSVESARARLIGNSIELASDTGRRLNYGKLIAKDAKGIMPDGWGSSFGSSVSPST